MAKRQIFYSFHFGNDVMRVQQIRNIGDKVIIPKCYTPTANDAYGDIANNIEDWVEAAIAQRS
jgi:hypothetical protein